MTNHIDIYLRYLAAKNFSPRTLENYSGILYPFDHFIRKYGRDLTTVTKDDASDYTVQLFDNGINAISINQVVIGIRSFFDWMLAHEYRDKRNPFLEIKKRPVKKLLPVFCIDDEIKRLYTLIEKDNRIKVQDVTMFDTFFSTGIRTSELCNLKTTDIIRDHGKVFLKIREGKGGKDREVIVQPFGWDAIEKHLVGIKQRGYKEDWIFPNEHGKKLLRGNVYKSIRKILSKVKDRKMGAHTLRHTFATYLMNHGTPLKGIQQQLGHESLATTQKYTHLDIDRLVKVHKQAHPKG
ncbi:MAG: tyrosine-type recombinase/integrase [Cyclobacteriaceae bacterium]